MVDKLVWKYIKDFNMRFNVPNHCFRKENMEQSLLQMTVQNFELFSTNELLENRVKDGTNMNLVRNYASHPFLEIRNRSLIGN